MVLLGLKRGFTGKGRKIRDHKRATLRVAMRDEATLRVADESA